MAGTLISSPPGKTLIGWFVVRIETREVQYSAITSRFPRSICHSEINEAAFFPLNLVLSSSLMSLAPILDSIVLFGDSITQGVYCGIIKTTSDIAKGGGRLMGLRKSWLVSGSRLLPFSTF